MVLVAPPRAEFKVPLKTNKNKNKKLTRIASTYEATTASMNSRVHQSQSEKPQLLLSPP